MMSYFRALYLGTFIFLSRTTGVIKGMVLSITIISAIVMMYFAIRLEIMKKNENIKTYKDILAFLNEDEN